MNNLKEQLEDAEAELQMAEEDKIRAEEDVERYLVYLKIANNERIQAEIDIREAKERLDNINCRRGYV